MLNYTFQNLAEAQFATGGYVFSGGIPAMLYNGLWGVYLRADSLTHAQSIAANFPGATAVAPTTSRISLHADGNIVLVSDNIAANLQIQDASGITGLGDRRYRGVIELARFAGSRLTAVNIIDIEYYLLSVVPAEMPASWHIEALMAQAVAARTFAVRRLGHFVARGFDVCDTTTSQVYVGITNEQPSTTMAVVGTRGIMVLHNGQPIEAVYSSSSGGVTENSENAWGSVIPYLRSVPDPHDTTGREWTRTITLTQLNQLLTNQNINIGGATGIRLDKHSNGRVQTLTILGTTGNHAVSREAIRWFFTPALDSRNFTIVSPTMQGGGQNLQLSAQGAHVRDLFGFAIPISLVNTPVVSATGVTQLQPGNITARGAFGTAIIDAGGTGGIAGVATSVTGTGYQIVFSGRGWGHGVGMSQHGAHGMALAGYNFRQILQHYYTGVEIR